MTTSEQYAGLWRASAMEKVPYTEDFPEALLVLPEFIDGCIAHGRATEIILSVKQKSASKWTLCIADNGQGIRNHTRLLNWAAPTSVDNYHRNGHGHKKAMTKFAPSYDTATWSIRYRRPRNNLITISSPFLGPSTHVDEDENNTDPVSLMPCGTETSIDFDSSVLGRFATASTMFAGMKEIIQTRMSEQTLRVVKFTLDIRPLDAEVVRASSHDVGREWHSLHWHVQRGVQDGTIRCICEDNGHVSDDAPWTLSHYKIAVKGNTNYNLKKEFPVYGSKNQQTQRVYISLEGRMIEAANYYKFVNKNAPHNDDNGSIVFVNFTSPDLAKKPQPSTTKVSMYNDDAIYKAFVRDFAEVLRSSGAEDAASVTPDPPAADPGSPPTPRVRTERINLVESALGVKFRVVEGRVFLKMNDASPWMPVTDFKISPRDT